MNVRRKEQKKMIDISIGLLLLLLLRNNRGKEIIIYENYTSIVSMGMYFVSIYIF